MKKGKRYVYDRTQLPKCYTGPTCPIDQSDFNDDKSGLDCQQDSGYSIFNNPRYESR